MPQNTLAFIALIISIASLIIAMYSLRTTRINLGITLREQWIEKFIQEFKKCNFNSYFNHEAGLPIFELQRSMPPQLVPFRREIIECAYFRAFPQGGSHIFRDFWGHLCEIHPPLKE
ncbi:MAG TPA: hypothetical protein VIF37_09825 [Methylobacter sp.]|jgi:hypothetical protein